MRSPKKKPFSISRLCSKFKVTNWSEYNNILRNRGRIDFMIASDLSDGWYEDNGGNKNRGGQRKYSDKAIFMCLQIRYLIWFKAKAESRFYQLDIYAFRITTYLSGLYYFEQTRKEVKS